MCASVRVQSRAGAGAGGAALLAHRSDDRDHRVGASTGGVEALKQLLMGLPAICPPIAHDPAYAAALHRGLCRALNRECPMTVSGGRA